MSTPVTLRDVVQLLERRYPPTLAADWDAVGLVCGDPDASVRRVLFAVDPIAEIVDEALLIQADLIVTHHPLLLSGVHSVAAVDHKGSVIHTLISHGIALFTAHTNADHANPGVSDALASMLGLSGLRAPGSRPGRPQRRDRPRRPARGGCPAGDVRRAGGSVCSRRRTTACAWPATCSLPCAPSPSAGGRVATTWPRRRRPPTCTSRPTFGTTGPRTTSRTAAARLVDVAHWASEWPWLPVAADALRTDLAERGSTVDVHVSTVPTDPWTLHLGSTR